MDTSSASPGEDVDDGTARGQADELCRIGGDAAELYGPLLGRALVDERVEAGDELLRVEALLSVLVDVLDAALEHVEAGQHRVDGVAGEPAAPLAQELEDVLHLVRELRHRGEAHRRAHALHRVRDAEDLIDLLLVLGVLLDLEDREVQLLQMLAAFRQEHREILGGVHRHALR